MILNADRIFPEKRSGLAQNLLDFNGGPAMDKTTICRRKLPGAADSNDHSTPGRVQHNETKDSK
jgi:hypothetical protein